MKPAIHKACVALEWCGVAVLVLVSLPLIAVTVFFLRAMAAVLLLVLIGATVTAWFAHEPFRAWLFAHLRDPQPRQG